MKRILAALLILLLLCGCAAAPETEQPHAPSGTADSSAAPVPETAPDTAPETETVPVPETEAALSGLSELTEGKLLLYRQADFEARQGTLLPMEAVLSAPAERKLPRTHQFDDRFPDETALWTQLLDYALANGYQGFSVLSGTLPELSLIQHRALGFLYRIDGGSVLSLNRDGCTTVWYDCGKDDTIEKFSLGLAEARRIAAEAPRGDDWETAHWFMDWLAEHVVYGERVPYYAFRGHLLYDALVEHDCICSGYAEAMYYLCSLCGIDSLCVQGLCASLEKAGGLDDHVWSLVRLNENWYCFDATWYDAPGRAASFPAFCGLSDKALFLLGGHKQVAENIDKELIPGCETCFDPVRAWNATPEGAIRSWVWYGTIAAAEPAYLPLSADLLTDFAQLSSRDGEGRTLTTIPYADFRAWTLRFMTEACADRFFSSRYEAGEDGNLIIDNVKPDNGIDWENLRLGAVTEADGVWIADLGAAAAAFTVARTADGRFRIESVDWSIPEASP